MFDSIANDIKRTFQHGNTLSRLIIVNIAVFIFILLLKIILQSIGGGDPVLYHKVIRFFEISNNFWYNLTHPWAIVTHMFMHEGLLHLVFNLLWLYWFGRILGDLAGDKHILPLYILGGVSGGLLFIILGGFLYVSAYALGASAAVTAIGVAAAMIAPDYNIRLILIGDVKLKFVVAALLVLDLISIANNVNTGGHLAHLGGAMMGWFYIFSLKQGRDFSAYFSWKINLTSNEAERRKTKAKKESSPFQKVFRSGSSKGSHKTDSDHESTLNAILDKINEQGYDSLSDEEKDFLYKASRK
jgi:membrane associated rhomboid family serine protease